MHQYMSTSATQAGRHNAAHAGIGKAVNISATRKLNKMAV
jgi:hypothetical protein